MHGADDWNGTDRRSAERRGSERPWAQSTIRVGSEMVTVAEIATSLESFGDQYLRRVYTDDETAMTLELERSYTASAKLLTVINDLLKTLMDAVR